MSPNKQAIVLFYLMLLEGARQKIASHISVHPVDGCWLWLGASDGRYGHVWYMGKRWKTHVLAFLTYRGRIPRGKVLDHEKCDRTRCCRPDHLATVTQSKNMKRCFAVGRGRSPFMKASDASA